MAKNITYKQAAVQTLQAATGLALAVVAAAWLAANYLGASFNINSASLWLGLIGTLLAFVGNGLITDAVTRYDARGVPTWRLGNYIQSAGFALTLLALLIK